MAASPLPVPPHETARRSYDSPTPSPPESSDPRLDYLDEEYSIHYSAKLQYLINRGWLMTIPLSFAKIGVRKRALCRMGVGNSKKWSRIRSRLAQTSLGQELYKLWSSKMGDITPATNNSDGEKTYIWGRSYYWNIHAFKSNAPPEIGGKRFNAQIDAVVQYNPWNNLLPST